MSNKTKIPQSSDLRASLHGPALSGLVRWFPLAAIMLCAAMLLLLERQYEELYVSQYHQSMVETAMRWSSLGIDLVANPMLSFGISVINPKLSPTYWLGQFASDDLRVPVQGAFQGIVMLCILASVARDGGAATSDAFAMGVIAIAWWWVPWLSNDAITFNTTPGIWQEAAIASLLCWYFFSRIGIGTALASVGAAAGMAATVLWMCLSLPYMFPFFVLTASFLCIGVTCAARSRRELLLKGGLSLLVIAFLLLLRVHQYILNIFHYTPQMFYETVRSAYFAPLSLRSETLPLLAVTSGNVEVLSFFTLAALGAWAALRYGNQAARRAVFAALGLEAMVHVVATVNVLFKLSPMTFIYVEQMGLPVVAMLAGAGAWTVLCRLSLAAETRFRPPVKGTLP